MPIIHTCKIRATCSYVLSVISVRTETDKSAEPGEVQAPRQHPTEIFWCDFIHVASLALGRKRISWYIFGRIRSKSDFCGNLCTVKGTLPVLRSTILY